MKFIPYTPEGTRDRLFSECRERRQVQSQLTHLFSRRGYAEIITPEVEFYDSFVTGGCAIPQESMLKVIDRSGKICVMRPECTIPIARVAATKLKDIPLPQRFYYNQNVYRSSDANHGVDGEAAQCGVELIGARGVRADLEMICMAVDSLRSCGLKNFHIEIGHAGIYRALASEMKIDDETAEQIRALIEGKNFCCAAGVPGGLQRPSRLRCAESAGLPLWQRRSAGRGRGTGQRGRGHDRLSAHPLPAAGAGRLRPVRPL